MIKFIADSKSSQACCSLGWSHVKLFRFARVTVLQRTHIVPMRSQDYRATCCHSWSFIYVSKKRKRSRLASRRTFVHCCAVHYFKFITDGRLEGSWASICTICYGLKSGCFTSIRTVRLKADDMRSLSPSQRSCILLTFRNFGRVNVRRICELDKLRDTATAIAVRLHACERDFWRHNDLKC